MPKACLSYFFFYYSSAIFVYLFVNLSTNFEIPFFYTYESHISHLFVLCLSLLYLTDLKGLINQININNACCNWPQKKIPGSLTAGYHCWSTGVFLLCLVYCWPGRFSHLSVYFWNYHKRRCEFKQMFWKCKHICCIPNIFSLPFFQIFVVSCMSIWMLVSFLWQLCK